MPSRDRLLELRNALPFLIWGAALAVALNSGWVVAYRLLYLFSLLIVLGLFWSGGAVWSLTIRRESLTAAAHVGDQVLERVYVYNRSLLPQLWVVLDDESELPLHCIRRVLSYLAPRSVRQFLVRTPALRRGRFRLGPSLLTGGDPFGIFRARRRLAHGDSVVIYPRVFAVPALYQLTGVFTGGGRRYQRSADPTTDVSTVREYQTGDEFARIHWPSTARLGRLISKEFEEDPGGDIWIMIDLHGAVQAGSRLPLLSDLAGVDVTQWPELEPSTEEYVVSLAASVADHFLTADRAVGMVGHSKRRLLIQADRGGRQLSRMLDLLAVISADGRVPLDRVLEREAHLFRRCDTVIAVTPSDRSEWVAAAHALALHGIRIVAVVVDRSTFVDEKPRADVRSLLASHRIPFCVVEEGQRPDEAVCVAPNLPARSRPAVLSAQA